MVASPILQPGLPNNKKNNAAIQYPQLDNERNFFNLLQLIGLPNFAKLQTYSKVSDKWSFPASETIVPSDLVGY